MHVRGSWKSAARGAGLLDAGGSLAPTIFSQMSALATQTGAINLGQGFPDWDGPSEVLEAAKQAIDAGVNQYPPLRGNPALVEAVIAHQDRFYGIKVDESEVLVTAGATEAIAASLLALLEPGDEVITFEPFYDEYAAIIALAGARHVAVPLEDVDALADAVTPSTRAIVMNNPHNPTGALLGRESLLAIVEVATRHDLVIVSDEVYEHLVFDGLSHTPIAAIPGAEDRTITISSAAKTFSVTGWKVGWLIGPARYVAAISAVKQYLTFVNAAPFQPAIALGLALPDSFYRTLALDLQRKRDIVTQGLSHAGFGVRASQGSYFVVADAAPLGHADATSLARRLPHLAGVVAVPVAAFAKPENRAPYISLLRFAACKSDSQLSEAMSRLALWQER